MGNDTVVASDLRVAVGGDHAGFSLKQPLLQFIHQIASVQSVLDCGTDSDASCDYPDFAKAVGQAIADGRADRGILVCGSGVGVSVAANKIRGVRASICHDTYSAAQGVEHDDMNVLCIGARVIGPAIAQAIVAAFLGARYSGEERHQRRLEKVLKMEAEG
ncbi:MAG: ribose 5-phosphate isomerase B [Planctomycetota bacterium]